MSKKLTTILLASASIAAISAIGYITYKKISKNSYYLLHEDKTSNYDPAKDSTLAAIKRAGKEKIDIDE